MKGKRDSLRVDRDFNECMSELEVLVFSPKNRSWKDFCDLRDGKGCAKYRECKSANVPSPSGCWQPTADSAPNSLQATSWCQQFNPLEETGRGSDRNSMVVAFSFGVICPKCNEHESDAPGAPLAIGRRQQCAAPCPFFGCAVSARTPEYRKDEAGPPIGCPYAPPNGQTAFSRSNSFARVQCFITRSSFLKEQTQTLQLHMGLFAFTYRNELFYLSRHPFKNVQMTHFVRTPLGAWTPDRYEHQKSHFFFGLRAPHPDKLLASNPKSAVGDSFLKRLRGEWTDELGDLSQFERDNACVYSEDGEMSAFCLRWILEQSGHFYGAEALKEGQIPLGEIATIARAQHPIPWYPSKVDSELTPRSHVAETYLKDRHLLPDYMGAMGKGYAQGVGLHPPPIARFMGFGDSMDGVLLLKSLGIMRPDGRATYRFWRLVRYLVERAPDIRVNYKKRLISLARKQASISDSSKKESESVPLECWKDLLLWVASAPSLNPDKAPFSREGCPGHIFLRRCFFSSDGQPIQEEFGARSWIVIPVFSYEPQSVGDMSQVGFFLGTFDDSKFYKWAERDEVGLSDRIKKLRRTVQLIGQAEAQGSYVEDIVTRSEKIQGIAQEKDTWIKQLRGTDLLGPCVVSPVFDASEIKAKLDHLTIKLTPQFPLALDLSILFGSKEIDSHPVFHGSIHIAKSLDILANQLRQPIEEFCTRLSLIIRRANSIPAGMALMQWGPPKGFNLLDVHREFLLLCAQSNREILGQIGAKRVSEGKWSTQPRRNTVAYRYRTMLRDAVTVANDLWPEELRETAENKGVWFWKAKDEDGCPGIARHYIAPIATVLGGFFKTYIENIEAIRKPRNDQAVKVALAVAEIRATAAYPSANGFATARSPQIAQQSVAYIIRQDVIPGADQIIPGLMGSGEAQFAAGCGLNEVLDPWIAVRDDKGDTSYCSLGAVGGTPRSPNDFSTESLNEVLTAIWGQNNPGVFRIFVQTWVRANPSEVHKVHPELAKIAAAK